jgi:hypothetical protein
MPPPKKRLQADKPTTASKKPSPKDSLAEYGLRLLNDAENSSNPALVQLRVEMIPKFFAAHISGNVQVSPRSALLVALPVLAILSGIPIYSAIKGSPSVTSVTVICLLFSLVFIVFMLAICGKMSDSVVGRLISGMFNKLIAKFMPESLHGSR